MALANRALNSISLPNWLAKILQPVLILVVSSRRPIIPVEDGKTISGEIFNSFPTQRQVFRDASIPAIPVATFAIGEPGAYNAGLFAASLIALNDKEAHQKLIEFRKKQITKVLNMKLDAG